MFRSINSTWRIAGRSIRVEYSDMAVTAMKDDDVDGDSLRLMV